MARGSDSGLDAAVPVVRGRIEGREEKSSWTRRALSMSPMESTRKGGGGKDVRPRDVFERDLNRDLPVASPLV